MELINGLLGSKISYEALSIEFNDSLEQLESIIDKVRNYEKILSSREDNYLYIFQRKETDETFNDGKE